MIADDPVKYIRLRTYHRSITMKNTISIIITLIMACLLFTQASAKTIEMKLLPKDGSAMKMPEKYKAASHQANALSADESYLVKNHGFHGRASEGGKTLIELGDNTRVVLHVTYDKSRISQLTPDRCLVMDGVSEKTLSGYKDGELCYYIFAVENKNGDTEKELIALIDMADRPNDYCDLAIDAAVKNDLSDFRLIWMSKDNAVVYSVSDSPLRTGFDKYTGRSFVVVKSSYTYNKTVLVKFVTPSVVSVNNAGAEQQEDRFAYYARLTETPLKNLKGYNLKDLPYVGNDTALGWYVEWRNPECGDGPFVSGLTGISFDKGLPMPSQTPPDCDMSEWDGWTRMERR